MFNQNTETIKPTDWFRHLISAESIYENNQLSLYDIYCIMFVYMLLFLFVYIIYVIVLSWIIVILYVMIGEL